MNRVLILSLCFSLISIPYLSAQDDDPCPCCSNSYKSFDFWIGDWVVYNTEGEVIGTNKIVKMQDGCVVQENWKASNGTNTGTSYNYFDTSDSTWNQLWISNTGNILELKGNLDSDGNMVLTSGLINSPKGRYYNQIIWSKNDDNSVTQQWDILNEQGDLINHAFKGIYRKKN
ncbi:MAG: hypothetical protein GF313_00200 [Caldithrix sp.]|nr:hypothetical protein [Caldithrix sp.]